MRVKEVIKVDKVTEVTCLRIDANFFTIAVRRSGDLRLHQHVKVSKKCYSIWRGGWREVAPRTTSIKVLATLIEGLCIEERVR